jgi:hypothetical protein
LWNLFQGSPHNFYITPRRQNMPRKPDPLRQQIKLLENAVKADRAERRAAEAPTLAARKPLADACRSARRTLTRWQHRVAEELASHAVGFGGWCLNEYEQRLSAAQHTFDAALLTLRLFDAEHGVVADYEVPVLDRDAVIRDARARHAQGIAAIRARYETPAHPPHSEMTI